MEQNIPKRNFKNYDFDLKSIEKKTHIYKSIRKTGYQRCLIEPFDYNLKYQNGGYDLELTISPNKAEEIKCKLKLVESDINLLIYAGFSNCSRAIKVLCNGDYEYIRVQLFSLDHNPLWEDDKHFQKL